MMYLYIFKADYGYILYIHKGSLESKTFKIERNNETIDTLIDRGKLLYQFKVNGVIPPAEAMNEKEKGEYWFSKAYLNEEGEYDKDECDGCPFLHFCLKNSRKAIMPPEDDGDDEW